MIYLIFCVLSNVGILLSFRLFKSFNINTFQAIVFNYVACVLTGIVYSGGTSMLSRITWQEPWVLISATLGVIFISTFYLMAITTQKFSMTVASIAAKMSLIIPVLISLFVLNIQSKEYSLVNYFGMAIALPAILLSSLKNKVVDNHSFDPKYVLLPFAVFLMGGLLDATINYTNYKYLTADIIPVFPIVIFSSAAIIGIIVLIIKRSKIQLKNILGGVFLGVVNYFSILLIIQTLEAFNNDGAMVYPLLNVGIIISSTLVSVFFFGEQLNLLNKSGIVLALISLLLISYQELIAYIN